MSNAESILIHPKALVETDDIGPGTRVWAFVHISKETHIGRECNVCDYAVIQSGVYIGDRVTLKEQAAIGTGVHIEDDAFIGPGVLMPNDPNPRSPRMAGVAEVAARYRDEKNWLASTRICQGATVGTGVIIMPGITVGRYAMIGAGALVTKDVSPHRLVVGNPARGIAWVCFCGMRLQQAEENRWQCECGRSFRSAENGGIAVEE